VYSRSHFEAIFEGDLLNGQDERRYRRKILRWVGVDVKRKFWDVFGSQAELWCIFGALKSKHLYCECWILHTQTLVQPSVPHI
jgi:hypothetical protein